MSDVKRLTREALARAGRTEGRADAALTRELRGLETSSEFTPLAARWFQQLLAQVCVASTRPVRLPLDHQPYWLRSRQPFAEHQSSPGLRGRADVVIVGAGLTGASAAFHLAGAARERLRVVVVDQGAPGAEASGRNGGNFELIPENCVGAYEGLARERLAFLRRCYPGVPAAVLKAESERQASLVFGLALRNKTRFKAIIQQERIDCDFSPRGWLYLAHTEREEQALCDEVTLAAEHGQRIELWSRRRIREEFGFNTPYLGRFIPGDGTYHPFKYVCGLLERSLRAGVELYTHCRVRALGQSGTDGLRVETNRGSVVARTVIVATNAFTSQLLPELTAIQPYQSQVMVTEQVPDRARGRVITTEYGPTFFSQPRGGLKKGRAPLLFGGGADRPMQNPSSRRRSAHIHARLLQLRDAFYPELVGQPPSAEWVGPMGFTPDQLPAIGFLRAGVIVAAGFNGYGGSYTTAAGQAAALMALTGTTPSWVPADVFSPCRFLDDEPPFMRNHESLWRIAASLCRQLRTVDEHAAEIQAFAGAQPAGDARPPVHTRGSPAVQPTITPARVEQDVAPLRRLATFSEFTSEELTQLLGLTRRREAVQGALVCAEGDLDRSCFIVLGGSVQVSGFAGGRERQLAVLGPGSIFGQVSLIDGGARSATCWMRQPGVLLELQEEPCARLFESRTSLALKFLAALNHGLIAALRGADRRLLKLDRPAVGQPQTEITIPM